VKVGPLFRGIFHRKRGVWVRFKSGSGDPPRSEDSERSLLKSAHPQVKGGVILVEFKRNEGPLWNSDYKVR